jgi:cellulose synthase operon protein C
MSGSLRRSVAIVVSVAAGAAAVWFVRAPVARSLARRHFSKAERMLATGETRAAASELAQALQGDPLHRRARRSLAELYLREQQIERAFLELQSYTDAFPEDPEGWSDLAEVRLHASQLEQAEAALTDAVDRAPERADLRLRRADLRSRIGRSHGALIDAQAVLRHDPGSVAARAIVAAASARLDAADCAPARVPPPGAEATAWPVRLGELMREFAAANRQLGRGHHEMVSPNGWAAGALASRARTDYPDTMLGPWLDGVSSLTLGDLDRAEQSFQDALAVSPRSHRPISNLVALWSRQRGPGYAGDRLVRMVDRDPAFAYPLPIAAAAYLEESQPTKAEATIRRMFRVLPESPAPFREVARFLLQLDRASDAIATAAQGLARFPADPELLREQARGYLSLGDREAALRSWDAALSARPDDQAAAAQLARLLVTAPKDGPSRGRALRLVRDLECDAPSDPDVLGAIGLVLLEAGGDAPRASRWLEAARDRAPESPQLRYHLALAYARARDLDGARRELQQAIRSGGTFDEEPDARRLLRELERH